MLDPTRAMQTHALAERQRANLRLRFDLAAALRAAAERVESSTIWSISCSAETGYRQTVGASEDPDAADRLDNLAELAFDAAVFTTTPTTATRRRPNNACECWRSSWNTAGR